MTQQPTTEARQQCRHLQPSGHRCPSAALSGHRDCYVHGSDRRRQANVRQTPAIIEIPHLDNRAAIQAVCTDLARGLAAGTLDIKVAHEIGMLARLALATLPPLPRPRAKKDDTMAEAPAPVAEIVLTPEGEEIAPETPYHEAEDKKEPDWSFAEFLYRQAYPEKADEPLPREGYVDPEKGSIIPPRPPIGQLAPPIADAPSQPQIEPRENGENMNAEEGIDGSSQADYQPKPGILPELNAVATPFWQEEAKTIGYPTSGFSDVGSAARSSKEIAKVKLEHYTLNLTP